MFFRSHSNNVPCPAVSGCSVDNACLKTEDIVKDDLASTEAEHTNAVPNGLHARERILRKKR